MKETSVVIALGIVWLDTELFINKLKTGARYF